MPIVSWNLNEELLCEFCRKSEGKGMIRLYNRWDTFTDMEIHPAINLHDHCVFDYLTERRERVALFISLDR